MEKNVEQIRYDFVKNVLKLKKDQMILFTLDKMIKNYLKEMEKFGKSELFQNRLTKKQAKIGVKLENTDSIILNIVINTVIDNVEYKLNCELRGLWKSYCESIVKNKIRKFFPQAYIKTFQLYNEAEEQYVFNFSPGERIRENVSTQSNI